LIESTLQLPEKNGSRDDDNIARLCRQICLCRARGQTAEASRLEAALRDQTATDEPTLQQIFSVEQRRVIDALILAELLGPMLVERLTLAAGSERIALTPVAGSPARPAARGTTPDIADLIEGMIEQERSARHHAA